MQAGTPVGGRCIGLAVLASLASLALAAPAFGADTYVDQFLGSDTNLCINPDRPCATVGSAIGKAGAGDTVHVAPGIYNEQLTLDSGKSLVASGTPASTVITSASVPVIAVPAAAGTIQGFTIRGTQNSDTVGVVQVSDAVTIRGNVFDGDSANDSSLTLHIAVRVGAGSPTITRNSFVDDGAGSQYGVRLASTASPTVSDNQMSGLAYGVYVTAGTPAVTGNVISGIHNPPSGSQGAGIQVAGDTGQTTPTITGNYIHDPAAGPPQSDGISIVDFLNGSSAPNTSAVLSRNRVVGGNDALFETRASPALSLNSDIFTGAQIGIRGFSSVVGVGAIEATNVTVWGNAFDISIQDMVLDLDSSIVEDAIANNGGACTISFSRGPATGAGCSNFTTTNPPLFVSATDFHLQSGSTMIGNGNPQSPAGANLVDIDGDPRAIEANCTPGNRDIGADEVLNCGGSGVTINSPAAGATTGASPTATFSGGFGSTFACSLDGAAFATCSSGVSFSGLANGAHTIAVRNVGAIGNRVAVTRSFSVDGSAPDSEIVTGPAGGSTSGPTANFTFSSEPSATYQCSFDGAAFSTCSTPFALTDLSDGSHALVVRAVDGVGNVDPIPVTRTWSVDATPPETTIDSGPADGAVIGGNATYGFSSEPGATFECSHNGATFAACTSPVTLTGLAGGPHTFAVRATDTFGNVDATPASRSLMLVPQDGDGADKTPPETTITKVKVKDDQAKVKFRANESATFTCKLDKGRFKPCKSPKTYKNLDAGRHKVKVLATDAAGNVAKAPAKAKFKI